MNTREAKRGKSVKKERETDNTSTQLFSLSLSVIFSVSVL